jgi:hypothetical protein
MTLYCSVRGSLSDGTTFLFVDNMLIVIFIVVRQSYNNMDAET